MWGKGYRLIMRKASSIGTNEEAASNQPVRQKEEATGPAPGISEFTEQELAVAMSAMRNNKSSGPDEIPAEVS